MYNRDVIQSIFIYVYINKHDKRALFYVAKVYNYIVNMCVNYLMFANTFVKFSTDNCIFEQTKSSNA